MVRSAHLSGIFWVVISSLCFVAVTGIVRHLGSDMNPIQAAFVRYAIGVALLLPTLLAVPRSAWRLPRLAPHALRGLTHGIGVMLWFFAMTQIPIADVTALGFTSPIFVTLGAALFLGERLRLRRMIAIGIGFAGMLVILRPGLNTLELGAAAMLLA
ncbi:MAG: DMT family transporter, partial [Pseudomonadota bacterium]|nr:DMT family transporter [Pseudomonadota bacterium]